MLGQSFIDLIYITFTKSLNHVPLDLGLFLFPPSSSALSVRCNASFT